MSIVPLLFPLMCELSMVHGALCVRLCHRLCILALSAGRLQGDRKLSYVFNLQFGKIMLHFRVMASFSHLKIIIEAYMAVLIRV